MLTAAALRNRRKGGVGVDMATAGAVLQLQHVVIDHRRFDFLVWALLEISRMTTRTVRFIPGEFPGNDLVVARMT